MGVGQAHRHSAYPATKVSHRRESHSALRRTIAALPYQSFGGKKIPAKLRIIKRRGGCDTGVAHWSLTSLSLVAAMGTYTIPARHKMAVRYRVERSALVTQPVGSKHVEEPASEQTIMAVSYRIERWSHYWAPQSFRDSLTSRGRKKPKESGRQMGIIIGRARTTPKSPLAEPFRFQRKTTR